MDREEKTIRALNANGMDVNEGESITDVVPFRLQDSAIVPIMTPDELEEQWNQYRDMENRILQEDDYVYWVEYKSGGKPRSVVCTSLSEAKKIKATLKLQQHTDSEIIRRKKKSAYRKMARFFGLFVPDQGVADIQISRLGENHFVQIEKGNGVSIITYMDEFMNTIKVEVTVTTVAPSGKASVGVGVCSAEERKFTHPDHDIKATAFTRALNRSISDLVGWGEVSAEEVLSGGDVGKRRKIDSAPTVDARGVSTRDAGINVKKEDDITLPEFLTRAFALGWTMDKIVERFGKPEDIADRHKVLEEIEKEEGGKDE